MTLIGEHLTYRTRGGETILRSVTLEVRAGEMLAIVGPNGAGKSTLMHLLAGGLSPTMGRVAINGAPLTTVPPPQRARMIAWLPQDRDVAWPITVQDLIALGRFAYGAAPQSLKPADQEAVDDALQRCGVSHLTARRTDTLSGGELARCHLARTLAAGAGTLLADEPIAGLDPLYQYTALEILRDEARRGTAVAVVLHDLSLAAKFADRIAVLDRGKCAALGPPMTVFTPALLRDVFGITGSMENRPDGAALSISGPAILAR